MSAASFCEDMGGHLPTLRTREEIAYLVRNHQNYKVFIVDSQVIIYSMMYV